MADYEREFSGGKMLIDTLVHVYPIHTLAAMEEGAPVCNHVLTLGPFFSFTQVSDDFVSYRSDPERSSLCNIEQK